MDPFERFEFSQSSLQDFVDCRRRFQLRYLQRVSWPAIQAEPARENERLIQRGERFHRLAQQYLIGVPEERLTAMASADEDENLLTWWQYFLECIPPLLEGTRHVEAVLETRLAGARLVAKYDLLLFRPDGRAVIYDWKTTTRKPPRARLIERLQTRVYPYLLVQAGAALNRGRPLAPDQVEMIYWFAGPGQPLERLEYDAERCEQDRQYLQRLIEQIRSLAPQDFVMSENEKPCRYCVYRSLCRRGVKAGDLSMLDDVEFEPGETTLDIDLEQIGEISF